MQLKFDTLDKKPKLYHLLPQAVVYVVVTGLLLWHDARGHAMLIGGLTAAFVLAVAVQLVIAFFRQMRYNPYSYNTIYYMGFALFLLAVFLLVVTITVNMIRFPQSYYTGGLLLTLLNSAKNYMLFSFPFLFVFSILMCVSNLSLIRHEGLRPVNVLGILLSLLLLGGVALLLFVDFYASGSQREVMIHDLFVNTFAAVYLYFECMLIGTIIADVIAAKHEPEPNKDFLIVLGCALRSDGSPTPLLRGRIDRALSFAENQKKKTGKDLCFVASGGQGADEVISESESIRDYLLAHGVPEERIISEDRSTNTFENMQFSKALIQSQKADAKIAFSTTNYHVFRSGLFARRVKMRAVGMGAKTKWYFWPNAAVREFVGLLTQHRVKQTIILCALIAAYIAMTLIAYR